MTPKHATLTIKSWSLHSEQKDFRQLCIFLSQIRNISMSLFPDGIPVVVSVPIFKELQTLCEQLSESFVNLCHKDNLMISIKSNVYTLQLGIVIMSWWLSTWIVLFQLRMILNFLVNIFVENNILTLSSISIFKCLWKKISKISNSYLVSITGVAEVWKHYFFHSTEQLSLRFIFFINVWNSINICRLYSISRLRKIQKNMLHEYYYTYLNVVRVINWG